MTKRVLVIQTAFLGDAILSTGLLEKIHHELPEYTMDLLVRKGNEGIFNGHPFLNNLLIWDKKKQKYKNLFLLWKKIRKQRYDLLINLQRFAASGLLTASSGATITLGFDKNPFSFLFSRTVKHDFSIHEAYRNQKLIFGLVSERHFKPKIYPQKSNFEKTAAFKVQRYITIAPASVWFTKQLPAEKWVELLTFYPGCLVYFVGSKTDAELAETIITLCVKQQVELKAVNLCGKLDILDTAALYADAVMNFTNDSGPMHIASAVNAPVRAVFCSTVEKFGFGPLSDNGAIIETTENLKCRPCGIHGKNSCPEGHFRCAYGIKFNPDKMI
jgi:heptosyltransferase-2